MLGMDISPGGTCSVFGFGFRKTAHPTARTTTITIRITITATAGDTLLLSIV